MINYHARKPIRDFLNKVTEPPYTLTVEEQDKCFEAIISVYEETANKEREDFLSNDVFDLLRTYVAEDEATQTPRDPHRHAMNQICNMTSCLISAALEYGVRLPEWELSKYEGIQNFFAGESFTEHVRVIYECHEKRKTPHRGTNPAGMDNDTTTPKETPTGAQEVRKKAGKRGRPHKEFDEFFNEPGEAATIIPTITRLLKDKSGKDAARIIAACCAGGWMNEPTPLSIERKFGICAAGLKEPLRCHFRYDEAKKIASPDKPKFRPFTPEEMNPIIDRIRAGMKDEIQKHQPPQDSQK